MTRPGPRLRTAWIVGRSNRSISCSCRITRRACASGPFIRTVLRLGPAQGSVPGGPRRCAPTGSFAVRLVNGVGFLLDPRRGRAKRLIPLLDQRTAVVGAV